MRKINLGGYLCVHALFLLANLKTQAQTWSFTGSMESPRSYHTATLLHNGQVPVAGGRLWGNYNEITAELFNPSSGTFTVNATANDTREGQTAVLLSDGAVLVAGGNSDTNGRLFF
jgi:hypothetical protein